MKKIYLDDVWGKIKCMVFRKHQYIKPPWQPEEWCIWCSKDKPQ